jgi:hypothetical protein
VTAGLSTQEEGLAFVWLCSRAASGGRITTEKSKTAMQATGAGLTKGVLGLAKTKLERRNTSPGSRTIRLKLLAPTVSLSRIHHTRFEQICVRLKTANLGFEGFFRFRKFVVGWRIAGRRESL